MKNRFLFPLVTAAMLASAANAEQKKHPKTRRVPAQQQLLHFHHQFIEASARGDAATMKQFLGEDYFVTGIDGKTANRSQALMMVKKNGTNVTMSEKQVMVRSMGDTGVVTGMVEWKVKGNGTDRGGKLRFTEVWAKRNSRWLLVVSQATTVTEAAERAR